MVLRYFLYLVVGLSIITNWVENFSPQYLLLYFLNIYFNEFFKRNKTEYYFKISMIIFCIWAYTNPLTQWIYWQTEFAKWTNWNYPRYNDYLVYYNNLISQLGLVLIVSAEFIKKRIRLNTFILIPFYISLFFFLIDKLVDQKQTVFIIYIFSASIGIIVGTLLLWDKKNTNEYIDFRKSLLLVLFLITEVNLLLENIEVFGERFGHLSYIYPMIGLLGAFILTVENSRLIHVLYNKIGALILLVALITLYNIETTNRYIPMYTTTLTIFVLLAVLVAKYKFNLKMIRGRN